MSSRGRGAAALALLLLGPARASAEPGVIHGCVIGLAGEPVAGALVRAGEAETQSGPDGCFAIDAAGAAAWVTVDHPGYLPRTRAGGPGAPVLLRLTPDDGETVSLHFVGDTMFGRRFHDWNGDGETSDALVEPGAEAARFAALLDPVRPLLAGADLTAVNLETPLVADPYFTPSGARPSVFHPTKIHAFASDPAAAEALRLAGVDVVGLGNNHLFDALEGGTASTIGALEAAGFDGVGAGHFGAGPDPAAAWAPLVLRVPTDSGRATRIGFVGCTGILGDEHAISYVAGPGKGGAAACDPEALAAAVRAALRESDAVVAMIHGGYEYVVAPSPGVRANTQAALAAGATMVMNHHPHVVGGFQHDRVAGRDALVAWSLGNFLFDQTRRETFETYLVAVHLRRGEVVRAYAEPLMIEGYRPWGLVGAMAAQVARGAAGRQPGPFVIEDGAMEIDLGGLARRVESTQSVGGEGGGAIHRLPDGWALARLRPAPDGAARLGRDLLWTGSFEDEVVGAEFADGAPLWEIGGAGQVVGPDFAQDGRTGLRLWRSALSAEPVSVTHHRALPIGGAADLTVVGMVRSSPGADLTLRAGFLPASEDDPPDFGEEAEAEDPGPEQAPGEPAWAELPLADTGGEWRPFRLDLRVPEGAGLLRLRFRLDPPAEGTATADLDAIRVIRWEPPGTPPSALHDHLQVRGRAEATLVRDLLPGAEAWAGEPALAQLWPAAPAP